jgi:trans-aconitate methyltransferase
LNNLDKEKYISRYNERLEEFGYDPRSLGWGTGGIERQHIRFRNLLEIKKFTTNEVSSVLDIGCGFGDCCEYSKKMNPKIEYTGIDINQSLIDIAKDKYPDGTFFCGDIVEKEFCGLISNNREKEFDIVISSGIFNYKLTNENQYDYICRMLKIMYSLSKIGVAADFLSDQVDFMHDGAFHTNIDSLYVKTRNKITKKSIFRNDYLDYEFTLYLLK